MLELELISSVVQALEGEEKAVLDRCDCMSTSLQLSLLLIEWLCMCFQAQAFLSSHAPPLLDHEQGRSPSSELQLTPKQVQRSPSLLRQPPASAVAADEDEGFHAKAQMSRSSSGLCGLFGGSPKKAKKSELKVNQVVPSFP